MSQSPSGLHGQLRPAQLLEPPPQPPPAATWKRAGGSTISRAEDAACPDPEGRLPNPEVGSPASSFRSPVDSTQSTTGLKEVASSQNLVLGKTQNKLHTPPLPLCPPGSTRPRRGDRASSPGNGGLPCKRSSFAEPFLISFLQGSAASVAWHVTRNSPRLGVTLLCRVSYLGNRRYFTITEALFFPSLFLPYPPVTALCNLRVEGGLHLLQLPENVTANPTKAQPWQNR